MTKIVDGNLVGESDSSRLVALNRTPASSVDKLYDFTNASLTGSDLGEGSGNLSGSTVYYFTVVPGNSFGSCKVASSINSITTATYASGSGAVSIAFSGSGANGGAPEWYDIFLSTDSAPKWVGRITEAQRLTGIRITGVGTYAGDTAAVIAGKIRTALAADTDVAAFFTVGGTGANITLTAKTKAANDTTLNIWIADGTCDGITSASSANTTPGVAPVAQVETAVVAGTISTSGNASVTVAANGMGNSPKTISVPVLAGALQAEIATVAGEIVTTGSATTIVTADGLTGSPKTISTYVLQGTKQVETCVVASGSGILTDGDAKIEVTATNMPSGSVKEVTFAVQSGIAQAEMLEISGSVSSSGSCTITVTAAGMTGGSVAIDTGVLEGVAQVETLVISASSSGSVGDAGYAALVLTSNDVTGSSLEISVYLDANDDFEVVATKVRAELNTWSEITDVFTVGGTSGSVTLTKKVNTANDATLNLSIDNDTCTGLDPVVESIDTTPGVAFDNATAVADKIRTDLGNNTTITDFFAVSGSGAFVILTTNAKVADDPTMNIAVDGAATGVDSAVESVNWIAGVAPDDAAAIAGKGRTALSEDADISAFFTISGSGVYIIATAIDEAANDVSMNLLIDNDTCTGIDTALESLNTVEGVAPDNAAAVAGKIRTDLGNDADIDAFFTVSGSGVYVKLTAKTPAADDPTMNISIADGTCDGLTSASASLNHVAGIAPDSASDVGQKMRTVLSADADVAGFFTISGSGVYVIATAKTAAADDVTMNIAYTNGTCAGLTPDASSNNTTAGVAGTLQVETATVIGDITVSGSATVIVVSNGMTGSPKTLQVYVDNLGASGSGLVDVQVVGTGIASSNAIFSRNTAYDIAGISSVNCVGKSKAHVTVEVSVTDLRTVPELVLVPLYLNTLSGHYIVGEPEPISLMQDDGCALRQEFVRDVDNVDAVMILVEHRAGQGLSANIYIEAVE